MIDVREILDRYGVRYEETYTSDLLIKCPFHEGKERLGSTRMDEETGVFNCFSCKESGSIYKFVALLENISPQDAYKLVKNDFNQPIKYDLDYLKQKQTRIIIFSMRDTYIQLADKTVSKILANLVTRGNFKLKQKWTTICSWIKYIPKKEELSIKYDQILELYSEFNQELKANESRV